MLPKLCYLLVSLFPAYLCATESTNSSKFSITIATENGPVKGIQKSSILGRNYFQFNTIPYMKAPLGKLRFRDAQRPEKWNEPLDATVDRPSYFTRNLMDTEIVGQEDAGILSITTPYVDRKLPVAVYIHGGGFQYAYGTIDSYGPDYLLQKDIVLVKINYRVGSIGFLSLSDPTLNIPGNAGLKDQVFALKWIQKNIANFGGDPDKVTTFGTSAGAASVHFLMMTDLAKGLFHRAIPMSGMSFVKTWLFVDKKEITERLAKRLGWDGTGGEKKILEVLENADAKKIVETEYSLLTNEESFQEHILFPFTPVIEPYVTENTFIAEDPVLIGRKTWSNDIDCMISYASLDGSLMAGQARNSPDLIQSPKTLVPRELKLNALIPKDQEMISVFAEKLRKLYYAGSSTPAEIFHQYLMFASDIHSIVGAYRAVLSRVNSNGKGKTYLYRFNVETELNILKKFADITDGGAAHAEDVLYLFKPPLIEMPSIESKEYEMIKKMVSIVTSFIINGDPNNDPNSHGFDFQPVLKENPSMCFEISNDTSKMVELPEKERMKTWIEILTEANIPVY